MKRLADVLDLFGWAPPPRAQPNASPRGADPAATRKPRSARPLSPKGDSVDSLRPGDLLDGVDPLPPVDSITPGDPAAAEGGKRRIDARFTTPRGRSAAETLAVVARVAPQFRRIVFTRNRRVMASVAEKGAALRLNAAFAAAPDDVLVAVGRLFSARDARTRARARDAVRRFIAAIPADGGPPKRRRRRLAPGDAPHVERLRAEFRRVNEAHFGGALPDVPLYLSGQMRRRNGHFSSSPVEIVISRHLCHHAEPGESEATLRHEMIHLWQHVEGGKLGHGPDFRAWARTLDVHPRATRPVRWKDRPR